MLLQNTKVIQSEAQCEEVMAFAGVGASCACRVALVQICCWSCDWVYFEWWVQ